MASGRPVSLSPSTTTNKAAKNTSKCQSINLSTSCVSRRASTITRTAPESAVHARFSPATKQAKIEKNTMQTIANKPRSSFGTMWISRSTVAACNARRKPKRKMNEIDYQSNERRRRKRSRELRKGNMRKMPNNHVLRIANHGGDAADVGAGCERDEIRQQRKFPAPDHRDHQRREHQTDRVIDQQRRENSRCERQIEQEPPWSL